MEKTVYVIRNHGDLLVESLQREGFEVVVGNGQPDEKHLTCCNVLIPGGKVTVDGALLDQAPNLELVVKSGVGYDRIDVAECTRRGIYVANTPLTNYLSVAEHTMMLMLAAAKKIYPISIYLRHVYPDFWCRERYEGGELYGKTLGIIGLGNIGRRVAELAHAFGMHIIGFDPYAAPEKIPTFVERVETMDEILCRGDFLSLHVAGGPSTKHMINEAALAKMKPNAILINVARGSVVDEKALAKALQNGIIAGAGLDVFENEPLLPHNPLMQLENVVATPHCAGNTADARLRTQTDCVANILDYYSGRAPRFALNKPQKKG